MRTRKVIGVVGICVAAIVVVVVVVRLSPGHMPQTPASVPALVTRECTDLATTSLKARAEVTDDGGEWITRRAFQYLEGDEEDFPEIIPLVNASFEYGNPPTGWSYRDSVHASRVRDPVKVGSYALRYDYPADAGYGFARTALFDRIEWAGKSITIGAWVKTDIGDSVRIECMEWGGAWRKWAWSSRHPGDGEWHFLVGTGTVPTDLTHDFAIIVSNKVQSEDVTFYVDGFVAAEGLELKLVFEDGEFATGEYSLPISGLEPDTSYRIRALVENGGGIGCGNVVTCQTLQ